MGNSTRYPHSSLYQLPPICFGGKFLARPGRSVKFGAFVGAGTGGLTGGRESQGQVGGVPGDFLF